MKPIETEAEYEAALAEAWEIFGAKPGTPEFQRLIELADAIEAYEDALWGDIGLD